jgi:hypothetical protein
MESPLTIVRGLIFDWIQNLRPVAMNLPNLNAVFRFFVKFVTGLYVESLIPGIHICYWRIGAELLRRMRVGQNTLAGSFHHAANCAKPAPKIGKTLIWRKAVNFFIDCPSLGFFKTLRKLR